MRIGNLNGRAVLLAAGGAIDVERTSEGTFAPDPQAVYDRWDDFTAWARGIDAPAEPYDPTKLEAPVPRPRQIFALGLNYKLHAEEAGLELPPMPLVFTKFQTCITGPAATVAIPTPKTDWEVELVAVIGKPAHHVGRHEAWDHIAGLTIGQDLSARDIQMIGAPPQFSLGKSFPGFGPTGPAVVTLDEFADPADLAIDCQVNGETMQEDRTKAMMFDIPETVARLSAICPLLPGDLIFTGTPAGVGNRMDPPRYLQPGDILTSTIEGIGQITTTFIAS